MAESVVSPASASDVLEDMETDSSLVGFSDDGDVDPNYTHDESRSVEENVESQDSQRKKSRERKGRGSKQEAQKKKKCSGVEYVQYRGKGTTKSAREIGADCSCPLKCFEKIEEKKRVTVFKTFWQMGDHNKQNAYLFEQMKSYPVKRHYTANPIKRKYSFAYYIRIEGTEVQVCKKAFLAIHGLQNSRSRIDHLLKTMTRNELTSAPADGRGKHCNHPTKYTSSDISHVREHIELLPEYQSHYRRHHNPDRHYMTIECSINSCYEHYSEYYCREKGITPVSSDKYRRIFIEEFNIHFKTPKNDTCSTCDELHVKLQTLPKASDESKAIHNVQSQANLRRRGRLSACYQGMSLEPKCNAPCPIRASKFKDVQDCLQWLSPFYAEFYKQLVAGRSNEHDTSLDDSA